MRVCRTMFMFMFMLKFMLMFMFMFMFMFMLHYKLILFNIEKEFKNRDYTIHREI